MKNTGDSTETISCSCGKFEMSAIGQPIMTVSCFCASCQEAARQLGSGDHPMVDADGATPFVLYRKDRLHFPHSSRQLREHRLSPESTTRRVVAACCGSPMFLEFENGHWLSVYARRFPGARRPAVEMRTMARDAAPGSDLSGGIPTFQTHSVRFMARLVWAWVLMGFRAPKVEVGEKWAA